jgi:hypothetical protein
MLIQPIGYFLLAWFILAVSSTVYVGWVSRAAPPARDVPETGGAR